MKYLDIVRAELAAKIEGRAAAFTEMEAAIAAATDEQRSVLTEDEQAAFDEARDRVDELDAEISALTEREAELADLDQRRKNAAHVPMIIPPAPEPPAPTDVRRLNVGEARDHAMRRLEDKDSVRHLRSDQVDKLDRLFRTRNADTDGDWISRLCLLTENKHYRSAFAKVMTQVQPVLTAEEARAMTEVAEFRAASSTTTAGGFGVPVLIDPTIIITNQGAANPIRRISRIETITTDAWKGVSASGMSWSWDAEAAEVSDDMVTLAQPTVSVHEARGFIPFSIRIGQDYPGFAEEVSGLLSSGYDDLLAQAYATGSGSSQPYGILTALDANTNVEVVVTTDGSFAGQDVNAAWSALGERYRGNATWVMSTDVANEVATFGNGNNLSFVTVDLTGTVEKIRTRPCEFTDYFPAFTGSTGAANILVVGDFRNYLIADRAGMTVELVPHMFATNNNRPTGQRGWFAWARSGADSINDLGFRLLQNQ